jgi:hypothetical protein
LDDASHAKEAPADGSSEAAGGRHRKGKAGGASSHLPAARLVHLSEDLDSAPHRCGGGNRDDEPWFMRKLLRQAARGGPIQISAGALGHDSDEDGDGEGDDPDETFNEMDFSKVAD